MRYKHQPFVLRFARSFLYFVFSRCGRFISRKIIPFCLCFVVLGLSLTIPSFAETTEQGTDDIATVDLSYYSTYIYEGDFQPLPVTRAHVDNYQGRAAYRYNLPQTTGTFKSVTAYTVKNFIGGHEYNLKMGYAFGYAGNEVFEIQLAFYDGNGELISTQGLYRKNPSEATTWYNVDINFKANTSAINSGYTVRLEFIFTSSRYQAINYYLTETIYLNDNDDDSGLLHSILQWLRDIRDRVVNLGSSISSGLSGLGDRFSNFIADLKQGLLDKLESVKTSITNAINNIQQWFIDLKDNIINGLKSLFIPSEGYFASKKVQLETFATEHFGALYQGPDVMIDLIRKLLTVDPSSDPGITMPAIEFDFQGEHYRLTEPIHYSFSWVNDSSSPVYYFYRFYKGFVVVILFMGFGNYLIKKYRNVFEGGGDA